MEKIGGPIIKHAKLKLWKPVDVGEVRILDTFWRPVLDVL
jgi:hypothetical protein